MEIYSPKSIEVYESPMQVGVNLPIEEQSPGEPLTCEATKDFHYKAFLPDSKAKSASWDNHSGHPVHKQDIGEPSTYKSNVNYQHQTCKSGCQANSALWESQCGCTPVDKQYTGEPSTYEETVNFQYQTGNGANSGMSENPESATGVNSMVQMDIQLTEKWNITRTHVQNTYCDYFFNVLTTQRDWRELRSALLYFSKHLPSVHNLSAYIRLEKDFEDISKRLEVLREVYEAACMDHTRLESSMGFCFTQYHSLIKLCSSRINYPDLHHFSSCMRVMIACVNLKTTLGVVDDLMRINRERLNVYLKNRDCVLTWLYII